MPDIGSIGEEQVRREIGSLFDSERWWRDQYGEIENNGYRLRPRYHPEWEPSWKRSGKPFFTMEDGQPTLVSVVCQMLPTLTLASATNRDGRNVLAGWETSHAQEGSCGKGAGDCPAPVFPGAPARGPQSLCSFVGRYRTTPCP